MSRKRIKPLIEKIPGYTEKQSQFIRGELDRSEVTGRFYRYLLDAARKINDEKIIKIASKELADCKSKAAERNRINTRNRWENRINGTVEYKPCKNTAYTQRHKDIICGKIEIDNVHTNELIAILKRAKHAGDDQLVNSMENIINDRRLNGLANRHRSQNRKRKKYDTHFNPYSTDITEWEYHILHGDIDPDECSLEHLQHILDLAKRDDDTENIELAEQLIQYRMHPESALFTLDPEEALNAIEFMIGLPIRRDDTWFKEETE